MNKKAGINLFLIMVMILFSSCYHKDVMNYNADDVIKVVEYKQGEKYYLILMETVFQSIYKSNNYGVTTVSGHSDIRISVYDLATGELLVRKKFGKVLKNKNTLILGCTPGNLWLYSVDKNLGFYSVDPLTLEVKHTQEEFLNINPELKGNLAEAEFFSILNFYSFDEIEQKPLITDNQGYRYYVDPITLKATKIDKELKIFGYRSYDYLSTRVKCDGGNMSLSGKLRRKISFEGEIYNDKLNFLEGQFIVNQNFRNLYLKFVERFENNKNIYDSVTTIVDSIEQAYGKEYWNYPNDLSEKYNNLKKIKNKLKHIIRENEKVLSNLKKGRSDDYLLQTDTNYFFIASRANTNKDAFLTISRINVHSDTIFSEAWKTVLPDVFFDCWDASKTNSFKEVFSKGNPDFDFEFFDIIDNKLVIVYALNMICINIDTGDILWQKII